MNSLPHNHHRDLDALDPPVAPDGGKLRELLPRPSPENLEKERGAILNSSSEFVTLEELANLLKVSKKTLRNKRSADPGYFPPALRIEGFRRVVWRRSELNTWLDKKIKIRE
ncbi:MAG: helix-turn-helix transcriptional regulator [Leptospirales bacterium]